MKIKTKELGDFLNAANKSTYANTQAPKAQSLRPRSDDYHFEQGDLAYHDTYFGARDFIGEEVVYKAGTPVWGMNYYGFVLDAKDDHTEVYKILRPALMQEYSDIIPVRGPREHVQGEHVYKNTPEGTLERFTGTEEIYMQGRLVYRGLYHGGFIE